MAPSWWSSSGAVKGYTAAQKASLKVRTLASGIGREREFARANSSWRLAFLNLDLFLLPLSLSLSLSPPLPKKKKAADAMLRESRSRSFEEEYEPLSSLGSGGAATVARCVHRASGAVVAAKRIPLSSSSTSTSSNSSSSTSSSSARQAALVELASLILLQGSPHTIELLDAIEEKADHKAAGEEGEGKTTNCVFLVTRLCAGGELFDSIVRKEHYCEREAALLVRSLASFLAAAHRVGVVHRDLKPENVMLLEKSSSSKSSSPTKAAAAAAAAVSASAAAAWPALAAPSSSLQRLPSRLCREASDVAAMLSACPPMRRPSLSGGERMINRRRTTGTGTAAREVTFLERRDEKQEEQEEEVPVAFSSSAAEESTFTSIEGRRRCSCLEREGIRVIDLGCAALFDPSSALSSSAAAAADAPSPFSTSTIPSSSSSKTPSLKKMIGTPYYAAPEVLPHSPFPLKGAASDVWSLGVIAFVLLSGRPPFGGRDDAEVARRVAVGKFSFRGEAWSSVSDAAKSAISSMLEKDPSRRATAAQVLESEWLSLSASKDSEKEKETEAGSAAAVVPAASAATSSSSSSSSAAANSRLRARIRAFAAESKLHAVAALALTRTVSGAEGAAQLREMILLQEEASEEEEEESEEEESSDGDGEGESIRPRLRGGGAAVVPSIRKKLPPSSSSYRCSAPGGFEVERKKNGGKGSAPVTPRAAAANKGASKTLGGLLRRTLTLGASSAAAAAALAAAAAALPPGCRECETCGGIVVESEEGEEKEEGGEEKEGAEAFLEGLLERGREEGSHLQPPPPALLRTQTTVGAERAAELAFAALDADGDGWLCVEDLLRAGREEGGGGEGETEGEGEEARGEKSEKKNRSGGCSSLLMTRAEAFACVAEASAFNADASQPGKVDFEGFKRVLWRRG